jgi:uncharacterized membrane protein
LLNRCISGGYLLFLTPILFIYGVRERGLWSDELFTVGNIGRGLISGNWLGFRSANVLQLLPNDSLLTSKLADATPPLYDLMLLVWMSVFGTSDIAIRSLSMFLATVLLLSISKYFSYLPNQLPKMLFLLLVASSPTYVTYSHESRSYMLTALTTVLWFLYGLVPLCNKLKNSESQDGIYRFWLLSIALIYTNYSSLVLYFIFFCLILISNFHELRRITRYFLFPILLFVPWLFLSYENIKFMNSGAVAWGKYTSMDIWPAVKSMFIFLIPTGVSKISIFLFAALFLLLIASILNTRNLDSDKRLIPDKLCITAIIIHSGWSFTLMFSPGQWHPRYLIADYVLLSILLISRIGNIQASKSQLISLLMASLLCLNLWNLDRASLNPIEDYKLAASKIAANYNAGTLIVTTWKPNQVYYEWYLQKYIQKKINLESVSSLSDVKSLCKKIAEKKRFSTIVIFRHSSHLELEENLKLNCGIVLDVAQIIPYQGVSVNFYNRL